MAREVRTRQPDFVKEVQIVKPRAVRLKPIQIEIVVPRGTQRIVRVETFEGMDWEEKLIGIYLN